MSEILNQVYKESVMLLKLKQPLEANHSTMTGKSVEVFKREGCEGHVAYGQLYLSINQSIFIIIASVTIRIALLVIA